MNKNQLEIIRISERVKDFDIQALLNHTTMLLGELSVKTYNQNLNELKAYCLALIKRGYINIDNKIVYIVDLDIYQIYKDTKVLYNLKTDKQVLKMVSFLLSPFAISSFVINSIPAKLTSIDSDEQMIRLKDSIDNLTRNSIILKTLKSRSAILILSSITYNFIEVELMELLFKRLTNLDSMERLLQYHFGEIEQFIYKDKELKYYRLDGKKVPMHDIVKYIKEHYKK